MPGVGTLGVSVPFADARYLRLSGANQASWSPTSTVVPNLNASLLEGHNAAYFSLSGHTHAHSAITGLDYASAGHTGFEPTVTKGNLTESTSSVLTIGSGTGAVIGSGTTLQVKQASGAQSGYLSSGDWTTFNSKQSALSFPLASNLGGTGVANNALSTLTISGNFATTLTVTNTTALTLPTSGYLVQSASGTYAALDSYLNQDLTTDSTVARLQTLTLGLNGVGGYAGTLTVADGLNPGSSVSVVHADIDNWNTAYGWGNHAGLYLPIGGGTVTGPTAIQGALTLGKNGDGGTAGSLVMLDGLNPGSTYTLSYAELGYIDGLNQSLSTTSAVQHLRGAFGTTVHATDLLTLLSSDTTASGNVLNISHSGNVTGSHTGINYVGSSVCSVEQIGQSISLTGAGLTNTCLKLSASGATNNVALQIDAGLLKLLGYQNDITITNIADHSYRGDALAAQTVDTNAFGLFANLFIAADGHYDEATADASTHCPVVAMALETGTGSKKILLRGYVRDDSWAWTTGPGIASLIYLSPTTAGGMTQTRPSTSGQQIQVLGWAITSKIMRFNPEMLIIEVP